MNMLKYSIGVLFWAQFVCISSVMAGETDIVEHEFCGKLNSTPLPGYEFANLEIRFPHYLEIEINGQNRFKDEHVTEFAYPMNGVDIGDAGKYLMIEAWEQDCLDLIFRRIFIISREGDILVQDRIWSSSWEEYFYIDAEAINYWSGWFCHDNNKEKMNNSTYIYSWPFEGEFRKIYKPMESICSDSAISDMKRTKVKFTPQITVR